MNFLIELMTSLILFFSSDMFSLSQIEAPLQGVNNTIEKIDWPTSFHYLGTGRQVFAFESLDGSMVLKFFKKDQLSFPWYSFFPFMEQKRKRIMKKKRIFPESYQLAYDHLREETGLIAVHLGATNQRLPTVRLFDKVGRGYSVDLNLVPFVLQKKAQGSFLELLNKEKGRYHQLIDEFLAFHEKRIRLCIADYDRDIRHNYGFCLGKLIYIDPARFYYDPTLTQLERRQRQWRHVLLPIFKWLEKNAPEEIEGLQRKVEDLCSRGG